MTSWRLILSPPLDGATNMALDHALALSAGRAATHGGAPPTLRLYRWRPACLSLGYFQRVREVNRDACRERGVDLVRRPTGGRAILHDDELTYAIAAPADQPGLAGGILPSYRAISAALLAGLRALGASVDLAAETKAAGGLSAACFDTPGAYEIVSGGRKLVGSAQTRTGGAILQHGSLLLGAASQGEPGAPWASPAADLHALLDLPGLSPADLAERMIALDEAAGRRVGFEEAAAALIDGFAAAWGVEFRRGEPTDDEWRRTAELRERRYANAGWTDRR